MNYIGSKRKLSLWIREEIERVVGSDLRDRVFCDLFAGTGAIGRVFKGAVKSVLANDLEYYSYVLNRNYIQNCAEISDRDSYIEELNALDIADGGFIYENYCLGGGSGRQYFSDYNGKKIDTIRAEIQRYKEEMGIGDDLYYFLLASLIESADVVANTASVYGAYLKGLKDSALQKMILKSADFSICKNTHRVFNQDSNTLIREIEGDILYLDPPYNHRQYGANYHILNTISLYDNFKPRGETGLRSYKSSRYCKKRDALLALEDLVKNSNFRYIFLSYNSEGVISLGEIRDMMSRYGKYDFRAKEYKRFGADSFVGKKPLFEYLHILIK